MSSFNTPILFLVFNRPNTTKLVFEKIQAIQPAKLYIAADGARADKEEEINKVNEVRAICNNIDWECEVHTLYRENNLGCGRAVSEAITWFFENVEEGIILEDDCLPDESFFEYCRFLLTEYRNDIRIAHIGGTNLQFGQKRGDGDYYYSIITHVWGWATWRRAWSKYQFDLSKSNEISESLYKNVFDNNLLITDYYKKIFTSMRNAEIDTWDYQWFYANILNNGLSICPNVNLIKNIGFGRDGTHTLEEAQWNKDNVTSSINILKKPLDVKINFEADLYTFKEIMGIRENTVFKNKKSFKRNFKNCYFKLVNLFR